MRSRLLMMLVTTLSLTACGGRQATPVAAEPIDTTPVAEARPAAATRPTEPTKTAARPTPPPESRPGRNSGSKAARKSAPARVYHILERGQTLYSVARLYEVPLQKLIAANGITNPNSIRVGTPIYVPGATTPRAYPTPGASAENRSDTQGDDTSQRSGVREAGIASLGGGDEADADEEGDEVDHEGPEDDGRAPERRASNAMAWPLHGKITGPYGRRGKHGHHAGIDIDGQAGDPICAAASGLVVEAGPDGPYGRRVVIEHGDGWTTLYAHAERLLVHEGETVHVGQRIALVGRSGNARGTHLHFEVRHDGRTVNPTGYLAGDRLLTAGVQ